MLEDLPGGIPTLTTVDWIEGVSHSNEEMMSSAAGIDKVAYLDVPFALLRELT